MHFSFPPDPKVVRHFTKAFIAGHANIDIKYLKDDLILTKHPLRFDDRKLVFLAKSLRGYIQSFKPDASYSVKSLRKKNTTVQQVCDGINKIIIEP